MAVRDLLREKLTVEHPSYQLRTFQLANLMHGDGRHSAAKELLKEVLAIRQKLYGPDGLGSQDASVAAAAMVQLLWVTRKECALSVGSTQNLLGPDGVGSQDASVAAAAMDRLMEDVEIQPSDGPGTNGLHEQILSEFKKRVLGPDFKKRVLGLCQEGLWSREEDVVMASMQELASMCNRDDDVYRDDRVKAINNVFGFVTICGAMRSFLRP